MLSERRQRAQPEVYSGTETCRENSAGYPEEVDSLDILGRWGKNESMECKEFEKLIPGFITKKLDYPTLKRFYEHVQQCGECREELDIQFLVQEGMQRLEEGNAFYLQAELGQRMEEAGKSIRFHSAFLYLGILMEIVAVGLLAGIVIWILL